MKKVVGYLILIFLIVMVLPILIVRQQKMPEKDYTTILSEDISVYNTKTQEVSEMPIEEFILGAVAAEMPASFPEEALKAQAVAARSYILYHLAIPSEERTAAHQGADMCTDYRHCCAWVSDEEKHANWGEDYDENLQRIYEAVESTKGQYLIMDGQVVNAVFHAMSGGRTENARDVWSGDVPYLKSVESGGEEQFENFETTVELSEEDFVKRVQEKFPDFTGENLEIGECQNTEGGAVSAIVIGNQSFKGTELRSILGLRSAKFTVEKGDGKFVFTVHGYGHGVGMSQYGARVMAEQGEGYEKILTHYYQGTKLHQAN